MWGFQKLAFGFVEASLDVSYFKNQICFVGICCKMHKDVNLRKCNVRRIHENLSQNWRRQSNFRFRFKKRRWMYREKDCGHKHYALFNEPLRDMTKEGWYLHKKTKEVDNWTTIEKFMMCVATYNNLSFWQSCHWSIKMHVVGEWYSRTFAPQVQSPWNQAHATHLVKSFPKTPTRSEASQFGGSHKYKQDKTKQNKTNYLTS